MSMFGESDERRLLHKIIEILNHVFAITNFTLSQRQGDFITMITGVQVGATGTFQIGFIPPNGVPLTSGPVVAVDIPADVTLGAVTPTFQFTAAVSPTSTATVFNLTISGVNGAGTSISHTFAVPVIAAPPPQILDFSLDQV
jgi:hypothetical protein